MISAAMRRRNEKETWLLEKPPRGERERERENRMYALLFSLPPRPPLLAPPPHSHFIFPEEEEKKPPFRKKFVSRKYQKFGKRGEEGKTYQFLPKVASATTKVRFESRRNVKISSTHAGSTRSRRVGVSSEANRNASFKRVCRLAVP